MLRVLLELFYQPLLHEGFFEEGELANIFPSLEELIDEHSKNAGAMGQNGTVNVMGITSPRSLVLTVLNQWYLYH